jgi:hypothetical protein
VISSLLGRIDGVDRRSDNPGGSGFDSRALQPRCIGIALGALDVIVSDGQAGGYIERQEAPQSNAAPLLF